VLFPLDGVKEERTTGKLGVQMEVISAAAGIVRLGNRSCSFLNDQSVFPEL